MNIQKVFQDRNVNKKFKFEGHIYTLLEFNDKLFLFNVDGNTIDEVLPLHKYIHGDFKEVK